MPSINLEDFKTALNDICRPNRFKVSFEGEGVVNSLFDEEDFYFVKGCSIPGESMGEIELNWGGYKYKLAGDPSFPDVTITFLNSILKNQVLWPTLRDAFDIWFQSMSVNETNERSNHMEYKCTLVIEQLDGMGKTVQTYRLIDAHPKELSDIALSMDSTDSVEEFTVVFSFSYFTVGGSPERRGSVGVNSSPFSGSAIPFGA